MSLWPNPSFLPKVVNSQTVNQVIEIDPTQPLLGGSRPADVVSTKGAKGLLDTHSVTEKLTLTAVFMLWWYKIRASCV